MFMEKRNNLCIDFTDVGNGKWLCNICKADVMTVKQAMAHEVSMQHSTKAEVCNLQFASSAGNDPAHSMLSSRRVAEQEHDYWADLSPRIVGFWRKGLEAAERGEEAESMHDFLDKLESELAEKNRQDRWVSSPADGWGWGTPAAEAEDWTPAPDAWAAGWGKPVVTKGPANTRRVRRRREGNSSTTSMHREGSVFGRDDGDEDTAFVENFLRGHGVDASRKERMRSFYEMPTDQKIQKIQEVIRDLRGQ
ncbi:hypothetical protein H4582DRAFT_907457 [Lactarius indigo]|nr:hypothetical protein H4582DRAFT_907457 [Lactarius indigo]